MAEKKTDTTAEVAEKKPGNKLKWTLLTLILLLVLGAGAGAAYYFLVYKTADAPGAGDEVTESNAAAPAVTVRAPLIYHDLEPFTANITSPGPVRFLRVKLSIATHDQAVIDAVEKHMPMIRNDLLSLLSSQEFASMNTPEGKDALRETLKATISDILTRAGAPAGVTDVLFTDFVMQ